MDEITAAARVDVNAALKEMGNDKIVAYIKKNNLQDYFRENLGFDIGRDIDSFDTDELIEETRERTGHVDIEDSEEIITKREGGGDTLSYRASNLLDIQIMEAFKEIMESNINHIDFLRHLQGISRNGLKPAA